MLALNAENIRRKVRRLTLQLKLKLCNVPRQYSILSCQVTCFVCRQWRWTRRASSELWLQQQKYSLESPELQWTRSTAAISIPRTAQSQLGKIPTVFRHQENPEKHADATQQILQPPPYSHCTPSFVSMKLPKKYQPREPQTEYQHHPSQLRSRSPSRSLGWLLSRSPH